MVPEDNSLEEFSESPVSTANGVAPISAAAPSSPTPQTSRSRLATLRFNRTALLITSVVVIIILLIGAGSILLGNKKSNKTTDPSQTSPENYSVSSVPIQGLSTKAAQLQVGQADHLAINGQLQANNTLVLSPSSTPTSPVTGQIYYNQTTNQPYYYNGSQFISLGSSSLPQHVTSIGGVSGEISVGNGLQITGGQLSASSSSTQATTNKFASLSSGTTNLVVSSDGNGNYLLSDHSVVGSGSVGQIALYTGSSTISGSILNQSGSTITLNGNLVVTGSITTGQLSSNGTNLNLSAGNNNIEFTDGGRTFSFPGGGGSNQIICTTGVTCASGGGIAVLLQPGTAQVDNGSGSSIFITNNGGGNLIELQSNATDKFVVNNSGSASISGGLSVGNSSTLGVISLGDGSNTNLSLIESGAPTGSGNATYKLPAIAGGTSDTVCLLTLANCTGAGGSVTTSGGAQNYITKYNNSGATQLSNSELYDNGSFVGLNTTTDNGQLSVVTSGTQNGFYLQGAATGSAAVEVIKSGGSSGDLLDVDNSSGIPLAKIDSSGNLTAVGGTFSGNISQTGNTSFSTGNGSVSLNGSTSVTGANTFTTGSGSVTIGSLGAGIVQSSVGGLLSSGVVDRNSTTLFANNLSVANGGTGVSTFTANGILFGNGNGNLQVTATADNSVLVTGNTGTPSLSQTLPTAVQTNITETGALSVGSIASGFGTISTGNNISTTATIQGNIVNATGAGASIELNGTNINTAGTLSNVAYLNATSQTFTGANTFSGSGTALTVSNNAAVNGTLTAGTLSVTANGTVSGTLSVQGSSITVGTPGATAGSLDLANASNSQVVILQGLGPTGTGNATVQIPSLAGGSTDTVCLEALANCVGTGGGLTGSGTTGTFAKFTGTNSVGNSSNISESGTAVTDTGSLSIQGASGLNLGLAGPSGTTGSIVFNNSSNSHTLTLLSGSPAASFSLTLPSADGGNGNCLETNGAGVLSFQSCTGGAGGGVTSLDSQSGILSLANSTGNAGTITINNAAADGSTKGIATFNSTDFTASAGVVDTIQGIANTSTPTFNGLTLTNALTVANGGTGAISFNANGILYGNGTSAIQSTSSLSNSVLVTGNTGTPSLSQTLPTAVQTNITETGALSVGSIASGFGTISTGNNISTSAALQGGTLSIASGNFTVDASGNVVSAGNLAVQGGSVTIGTSTNRGTISLADGTNTNLSLLQAVAPTGTGNATYTLPAIAGGTADTVCLLTLANCTGAGGGVVTTGGAQNYITKYNNAGATQITNSELYDNGSFVGLNTTTNNGQLSILASGTQTGFYLQGAASGSNPVAVIKSGGSTGDLLDLENSGGTPIAKINSSGSLTAVGATFTGSLAVQGSGGITVGSSSIQGVVSFGDGTNTNLSLLQTAAPTGTGNATYNLPALAGGTSDTVCLLTLANCVGTGGGITGSGTSGIIAKFNGTDSVTNSNLSESGTTLSYGGNLVVNAGSGFTGNLLNLEVNSGSKLSVDQSGDVSASGTVNGQTISSTASFTGTLAVTTLGASGNTVLCYNASSQIASCSTSAGSGNFIFNSSSLQANGNFNIQSSSSTYVGGIIEGAASQTADLLEFKNSGGSVLDEFTSNGVLQGGNAAGLNVQGTSLYIAGGQGTGNVSGGNINFQISTPGVSGSSLNALATVASISGTNGSVLFKNSSNSTAAFQIQNSSAAALLTADTTNMRLGVDVTYSPMAVPTALAAGTATSGGSLTAATYYYEVTAIDSAGGETTPSNESSSAASGSNLTIPLTWNAVTGASAYKIYRSTSSGGEVYLATVLTNSYTDSGSTAVGAAVPPTSDTAFVSTNVSSNNLQLSVGGNGTPTGQLYVSGTLPTSALDTFYTGYSTQRQVAVQGNFLYVDNNATGGGLQIIDISNPAAPVEDGFVATAGGGTGLYVRGHYAYYLDYNQAEIQVIDVSNPSAPTIVGSTTVGSSTTLASNLAKPYTMTIQGKYAYITEGTAASTTTGTMVVVDISNPAAPAVVSTISTDIFPQGISVSGRYAYVTSTQGSGPESGYVQVIDISNPYSPSIVGSVYENPFNPALTSIQGNYMYVVDNYDSRLDIFSLLTPTSPTSPSLVGYVTLGATGSTGALSVGVAVQGRYAYVTNNGVNADSMSVVDISNPYNPVLIGAVPAGTNPYGIAVEGRYAYVINGNSANISIYDLGGAYVQQLEAGGIQTGTLNTTGNANISGDLSTEGGLTVGSAAQINGNLGVAGNTTLQGTLSIAGGVQGGTTFNYLSAPTAPTITTIGGGTGSTWGYKIDAVSSTGTTSSSSQGTATGSNSLSSSKFEQISWSAVPGATEYVVYRTQVGTSPSTTGIIAVTNSLTLNDTGLSVLTGTGFSSTPPTTDSSGQVNFKGQVLVGGAEASTTALVVQNASAADLLQVDTTDSAIGVNGASTTAGYALNVTGDVNISGGYRIGGTYALQVTNSSLLVGGAGNATFTGTYNQGEGIGSLAALTSGTDNVAVGPSALAATNTGSNNTAVGYHALAVANSTNASGNAAIGYDSLNALTTGEYDTGIGINTGTTAGGSGSLTTGTDDTLIGIDATLTNTSNQVQNAAAIGAFATVNTSNSIVLGCINGVNSCTTTTDVGIGNNSPANLLSVGALTTAAGTYQIAVSTGGTSNSGILVQTVSSQSSGYVFQAQNSSGALLASIDYAGNLSVKAATINGTLTVDGHIVSGNSSGTTSTTIASGLGSTGTCVLTPTNFSSGDDTAGTIVITPGGTGIAASTQCTINFGSAYGSYPHVVISPANSASAALVPYAAATSTSTFILGLNTAGSSGTSYTYNYFVVQ